jgi:predicted DNA-binding protein (UPF0251 family)
MLDDNQDRIRELNDALRTQKLGGCFVITAGIAALGPSTVNRLIKAVGEFDSFTPDNDPHGEHDCAVMTVDEIKIIWKIDYYDLSRRYRSPNAADISVTSRILTIMRADEY